jgi:uncharacterized membrane protein (UPF0127 family)
MQGSYFTTAPARAPHVDRFTPLRRYAPILLTSLVCLACTPTPEVVIQTGDQPIRVRVEVAVTPEQQARGLMYRASMPEDAGMLFVFPENEIHSFWMKNTPLPLDMIFIDESNEIVGIVENTTPFSTTSRSVGRPSRYVLEVNAGFAAKHGLKAGQAVELRQLSASP